MLKVLKTDLKKGVTSPAFYVCILATFLLCMLSGVYYDADRKASISTVQLTLDILAKRKSFDAYMSAYSLYTQVLGGWVSMFLPVLVGFCFVPLLCDEQESGLLRVEIIRASKCRFWVERYLSASLLGGLAILLGYGLYIGAVYLFFPVLEAYKGHLQFEMELSMLLNGKSLSQEWVFAVEKMLYAFLYGAFGGTVALLLSCFTVNRYLVLCVPFFVKYVISQSCIKIMLSPMGRWSELANIVNPDGLLSIDRMERYQVATWIYHVGIWVLGAVLYVSLRMRRLDHGE